jgi:eukaryotic-like serine/threonine-protein kinase
MGKGSVQTLLDRYEIVDYLGQGARSNILLVKDKQDSRKYALKRVFKRTSLDQRFIEQTETEFEASRDFQHPVLRKSYNLHRIRRWLRVVEVQLLMEYFSGRNLEEFVTTTTLPQLVMIFTKVADGLLSLHQLGWVHADIKPNNILVNGDNMDIRIIDFGQSCRIGAIKKRIQGTPDYIAPEQVHRLPLDQRTDVFNLGATMYWMLTEKPWPTLVQGSAPRPGQRLAHNHQAEAVAKPPHEVNDQVPPALSRLVMDCCQERLQDRPGDMKQVLVRLDVVRQMLAKTPGQWLPRKAEAGRKPDIDATGASAWPQGKPPQPTTRTPPP